ncbi:MAG: hypothetical protein CVU62_00250 [Deltaproteobacteria bacterium HGW-Deltaproteobacteria-2]|jgi:hypothetical protein|nr:MAG: hypothetical protein CVU62_00250 [Deltaproteobacteria bacterium HGW-Deltaproteobacteria-2]
MLAFGDNKTWITDKDMEYVIGKTSAKIVVPKGFVTDFASIPQFFWSFGLSPNGQYSRAAIIHDYLYWAQGCSRKQADRLLAIAMQESNVCFLVKWIVFYGVDWFGDGAWQSNAKEKAAGMPRVIPEPYSNLDNNPNVHWPEYRQKLIKEGVKDPVFDSSPPYCKYGDSTTVP